ncbi:hypothetical protein V492_07720 [Pseudogymnoascus sp. VKM F-4246]|nr:hypothetical protein V492_07720 [Pseudogymnoascus sp. VKM F-4246]
METEHSVRVQTLRDITDSISDLYRSIMANHDEFEKPQDLGYFSRDSTKALGKLIAFNKDEATKAEKLLTRLHSELQVASSRVRGEVSEEHVQDRDGQGEDTMWEKVEGYSMAWLQALEVIQKIFGMFAVKAKQMEEFWGKRIN